MLLSQRIAQDPTFLERANKSNKQLFKKTTLFDIRMMVIKAQKFLVGQELVMVDGYITEKLQSLWELAGLPRATFHTAKTGTVISTLNTRVDLYKEFSKLPYPLMMVESNMGLLLIEQSSQNAGEFRLLSIASDGNILPSWTNSSIVDIELDETNLKIPTDAFESLLDGQPIDRYYDNDTYKKYELIKMGYAHICMAMECLLYTNIANTRIPVYSPNKRELKAVPKPFHPRYSYRVINIFRDRKEYHSLDDVGSLWDRSDAEVQQRRAHLVRGHFKRKNGKLFWWNAFMRNHKNLDTLGGVDKDYQLK